MSYGLEPPGLCISRLEVLICGLTLVAERRLKVRGSVIRIFCLRHLEGGAYRCEDLWISVVRNESSDKRTDSLPDKEDDMLDQRGKRALSERYQRDVEVEVNTVKRMRT